MKAMILAAGFGTRLLPFTERTPKPLFPIAGPPLLDIIVQNLQEAGFEAVMINTHHLHQKIETFIADKNYDIPVYTRYEPEILGTGGAIKNVADFWDDQPFLVMNSDIFTNIDLRKVYDFHLSHDHPVTMVLHDCAQFNTVSVTKEAFVAGFQEHVSASSFLPCPSQKDRWETSADDTRHLAFTGIQVLNPEVLEFIPNSVFYSSIDAYRKIISTGKKVKAFLAEGHYWKDIGTPQGYRDAVFEKMAPEAFRRAWSDYAPKEILRTKLKGDGSDRKWYRLTANSRSLVMVDHGIRPPVRTCESDSFAAIGRHLDRRGAPVPKIHLFDPFAGLVFLEDLGDLHLQTVVQQAQSPNIVRDCYRTVIDLLIKMSIKGARDFDLSWTYQTGRYDKDVVLEKECRYFMDAFVNGYLQMGLSFEDLKDEFVALADHALEFSINGFMHRDMQSRNIMIRNGKFYFIDFQGGRMGPIQYDLASLLIDPYVDLPHSLQSQLLDYGVAALSSAMEIDPHKFRTGFKYCALSRNLQILGAFGFLSRAKGKTAFEQYIPTAAKTLEYNLAVFEDSEFCKLRSIVKDILRIND